MTQSLYKVAIKCLIATSILFSTECYAVDSLNHANAVLIAAKKPKCSAPGVADFEGTDMSGVTPKCDAIFNACIDESAPCAVRKQKCAEFDKMDRNGSCYKKKRS